MKLILLTLLLPLQVVAGTIVPVKDSTDLIIERLIQCESSGRPLVVNWTDRVEPAYGILQFQMTTFREMMKRYNFNTEGWEDSDYMNAIMDSTIQRKLARLMLEDNLGERWGCFKKI